MRFCEVALCWRSVWNRDVNAAINILVLLAYWLAGQPRPAAFRPAHVHAGVEHAELLDWEALLALEE